LDLNLSDVKDKSLNGSGRRLLVISRILVALFSLLWLYLGVNSIHTHWGEPSLSEGIGLIVISLPFLAVSIFGNRSVLVFFLWALGLIIVFGIVGQGIGAGAKGVGQAIVVLVAIFYVVLALLISKRTSSKELPSKNVNEHIEASESKEFPELYKLTTDELEAIVANGGAKYSEAYTKAVQTLIEQRKFQPKIEDVVQAQSLVSHQTKSGFLPQLSEIDKRVLWLSAVFLIAGRLLEIVINHLMDPASLGRSYIGLLVAIFLSFKLLEFKGWARSWIITLGFLALLINPARFYFENNIFGAIDSLFFPIVLLALVCLRTSYKRGLMYVGAYSLWLVVLFGLIGYGVYGRNAERKIIEAISSPNFFHSDKNYNLVLGALNWKIVPRADMLKISPALSSNVDLSLARTDASAFGALTPESLEKIEVNDESLTKIKDYISKQYFPSPISKTERRLPRGVLVSGTVKGAGQDLAVVSFWNAYDTLAINGFFWGTTEQLPSLTKDVETLLKNLSEVPLKERLPKLKSSEVFSRNSDAVVLIRLYDATGKIVAFGSGFNVRKDGLIVTNFHVVLGGGLYMDVKFPKHGVYENVGIAGVGANGVDLAILKISGKDLPAIEEFRGVEVEVGDPVYVISNPEGLVNSLSEGIVSALRPDKQSYLYQFTAPISSGSSGGAVFNQFGQVIGLATSVLKDGQNLNFAVPVDEVAKAKFFKEYLSLKDLVDYLNAPSKK